MSTSLRRLLYGLLVGVATLNLSGLLRKGINPYYEDKGSIGLKSAQNKPLPPFRKWVRTRFPECRSFLHKAWDWSHVHYTNVTEEYRSPYDHVSCFVMLARYNCAHGPNRTTPEAQDYQVVLQDWTNNDKPCDLRAMMHQLEGPVGVAKHLQRRARRGRRAKTKNITRDDIDDDEMVHILYQGNSYLRQIFEAMICIYSDQTTDLQVQIGGPALTLASFKMNGHVLSNKSQVGRPYRDDIQSKGCHGNKKKAMRAYRPDAIIPPMLKGCNDNVAMVEFGHSIRFYYIFRPYAFDDEALESILQLLGITKKDVTTGETRKVDIDFMIYNEKQENTHGLKVHTKIDASQLLPGLKEIQLEGLGNYFGADNPFVYDPPDIHPCMPGIPDDEVMLLFFWMLRQV